MAQHLADLDISWWREKGTLTVDGQPYSVYRERLLSGRFILESTRDMFTRTFELREGSTVIGSLSARGYSPAG